MEDQLQRYINAHQLFPPEVRLVAGISGGVDSVVLTQLLHQLGYRVVAAHVNYRFRGKASDEDEAFVHDFCARRSIPFHVRRWDVDRHAEEHGSSIQAAARRFRYSFFGELAATQASAYVAVAHHLDDQAETVLLNLFRGSGPEGMAGMRAARPLKRGSEVTLVRPLLWARREAIEAYARERGLSWRVDASNEQMTYQRNVLRNAILPLVEDHFGEAVTENVARAATLMRDYVDHALRDPLDVVFVAAGTATPEGGQLRLDPLQKLPSVWRRRLVLEALKRWMPQASRSAAVAREVEALVGAQPGRRVELGRGVIWRERECLVFVEEDPSAGADKAESVLQPGVSVALPGGTLRVELLDERPAHLDAGWPDAVFVDADRLSFPLTVRRWQAGDRLQPLGMTGTKKVSDILTDDKVPSHERAKVPVILSDDEVIWVVGYRMAAPARVRPETRRVARITFDPNPTM